MIFKTIERFGLHEQVIFFQDSSVHLKGIIAIHSTRLGPSLGGCRMWPYLSEEAALEDVLKLSRGMTYKAAIAGLSLGGGKSVIIGDPKEKTPEMFRAFARFVQSLNGHYITAEDVGTTIEDMRTIREETNFVVGLPHEMGGSGDPSPFTARSTLLGIKAAVQHKMKINSLKGLRVAIQGMGNVGYHLAEYLLQEKCELIICDILARKVKAFQNKNPNVKIVEPDAIYDAPCDIFSPCALGGVIHTKTLNRLKCSIIAGGANNQLDSLETEDQIKEKGILYMPDFVINAGGLINVFVETAGSYSEDITLKKIDHIYDVLIEIFEQSERENKNLTDTAIAIANSKIYNKSHQHTTRKMWIG